MPERFFLIAALLSSLVTSAQVTVSEEPRHHNVFENGYIRILDVYVLPHDTTRFHVHATPSVFVTLSKTHTGSQLLGAQPASGISTPGQVWYDSLLTPRIHRVWNEDTSLFHAMDIELTAREPLTQPRVLQNPFLQLLFNEPLVNGYRVQLQPGRSMDLAASPSRYLFLSTHQAIVEQRVNDYWERRTMKAGHFIWVERGESLSVVSREAKPADFLLLQLK